MKRYEPPAGWIVQAYRFALDPSDAQVLGVRRNTGAGRFVELTRFDGRGR